MIGKKGVFITITAFLLAGMLLLSATNLSKIKSIEEDAITLALASQKTLALKENLTDLIKSTYTDAGITWRITDNNTIIYRETLPELTKKNKIIQNLSKTSSFFYHEFPSFGTYNPESIDAGKILVLGKDMNIMHSSTSGFGTNREIRYIFSEKNFNTITFDINSNATTLQTFNAPNLPLCVACTNPLNLNITIRNSTGAVAYSFSNTIDLSQAGSLDLNSTVGTVDLNFTYNSTRFILTNAVSTITQETRIQYNDPNIVISSDPSAIQVTELRTFGLVG